MKFSSQSVKSMHAYEWGEQPKVTKDLIKLNTNENPYPPHSSINNVLSKFDISELRLYPDPTCLSLIEKASAYFKVKPNTITIGNGSDELIALIFKVFFNRQDNVLFTEHTYSHYKTYADAFGITTSVLPMSDFNVDLSLLNKIRCKVFFLTNPNAPTGIALEPKEIEHYISRHQGKLFIIDEAYADFAEKSCISLTQKYDNVLVLRTFSKSFSLCGIRLGFAIGHHELINDLNKVKDPYNINALTQRIGMEVFKKIPYYQRNIEKIKKERERFSIQLSKLGFEVLPSKTNFVFCKPPSGVTSKDIFDRLKTKQIYVRYFSQEKTKAYLRVSIGTRIQMNKVLKELTLMMPSNIK